MNDKVSVNCRICTHTWAFAEAHVAEADTITVLWDQESTGHNEYLADEVGRTLDHIPLQEIVQ